MDFGDQGCDLGVNNRDFLLILAFSSEGVKCSKAL